MSRIVAPFLTRTAYRMYATNAGTEQKAGMAAIKKAAEEQGLRVEKVPAIELISKQDFSYLIQAAVNIARAKLAPKNPLFART